MSDYNVLWRRYGLKDNPYFVNPLNDRSNLPLSLFIGRQEERRQLANVIRLGEARCIVVGEPGVGKTTLVNFVRKEASNNQFFTPSKEIEINKPIEGNELIILTLSAIHDELKWQSVNLEPELMQKLDALYELTQYGDLTPERANISQLNRGKLLELFREVVSKIVHPRYKGIIIHYDNLDNIDNPEDVLDLISDVRDFLLTQKIIFIFVGDNFLPAIIYQKPRVSQIFINTPIEVKALSYEDILRILEERLQFMKSEDRGEIISPHIEGTIKKLFQLHDGNLREVLNSITECIKETASSNSPIIITEALMSDILSKKVNDSYITKLSVEDKKILRIMLDKGTHITPTELAKISGKSIQNISSKYLRKLTDMGAVRFKQAEGRNRYYEVTPVIKWWKLQRSEREKQQTIKSTQEQVEKILNKSLREFM